MNNDFQKIINNVILYGEKPKDVRKEELVSVRSILLAEKERHLEKDRDINEIIKLLQRNLPLLTDVTFYHNITDSETNSIILWLRFSDSYNIRYNTLDNYVMLVYKKGTLEFLNPIGICDWFKKIILIKDKELYMKLARYGIEHYFNVDPVMPTISGNFKVYDFDNAFSIAGNEDKKFKLYHLYNNDTQRNTLETKDGNFHMETNIYNLKKLFFSKKRLKTGDNAIVFLNNTMVYESDVPSYLKTKIKRI